ncbi:nuclear transport factor 2 family protein [Actinomycetospora atypica]|uniref:Nuclear transport factor 2 family protein n=1 Tax=Actinomycetospora atypica TaxID=1290095 RepID=A0ABV9YG28_9PSEU
MSTTDDLMNAQLLGVFNERDPERRRKTIEDIYAPDVVFSGPGEAPVTGHDELDAAARRILDGAPDFVFSPAGKPLVTDDLGHLAWNLGPEGRPPVVRGFDVALVRDGLIVRLWTFLLQD